MLHTFSGDPNYERRQHAKTRHKGALTHLCLRVTGGDVEANGLLAFYGRLEKQQCDVVGLRLSVVVRVHNRLCVCGWVVACVCVWVGGWVSRCVCVGGGGGGGGGGGVGVV